MTYAAYNPMRFVVLGVRGLIAPGVPVVQPIAGSAPLEGIALFKVATGDWLINGPLMDSRVLGESEVFPTVSRLSGRIRCAQWLHRAMRAHTRAELPAGSLGPSWDLADAYTNAYVLSGNGWAILFHPGPEIHDARIPVPSLFDLSPANDVLLPDGSSTNAALALKLAVETVGHSGL